MADPTAISNIPPEGDPHSVDGQQIGYSPREALGKPTDAEFESAYQKVRLAASARGVEFVEGVLANNASGFLDGRTVGISGNLTKELQLYLMLHFSAHCIEWAADPSTRRFALDSVGDLEPAELQEFMEYEHRVAEYSGQLLVDAGVPELLPWLAEVTHADLRCYVDLCVQPDKALPMASYRAEPHRAINPLPIPDDASPQSIGVTVSIRL